jgi:adenylosuccinate synthase
MAAIIVVDAFWGDSGKGKIAAYLARKHLAAYSARAGTGTNAGHSIYFADGGEIRTHQLPCGFLHLHTQVRVGSGVAVDPERFFAELDRLDPQYQLRQRTRLDYRCPIILPEYREREAADAFLRARVGTTASGTGVARAEFALRRARQARELAELGEYTADVARELNQACAQGQTIVIEGSQGTHLSLALSADYPHCTSDNCTAAAFADDVGLSWRHIAEVVLVVKALPTRVGQGFLPLELEAVEEERRGIVEYGVTTGRRRRKASGISWAHLEEAVLLNGPTCFALTFCDHLDPQAARARTLAELTPPVRRLIDELESRFNLPVALCDSGKYFENIVDLG